MTTVVLLGYCSEDVSQHSEITKSQKLERRGIPWASGG